MHPCACCVLSRFNPRMEVTNCLLTHEGTRSRMPFAFTHGSRRAHTPEPILTAPVDYLRRSAEGSVRFFSSEVHARRRAIKQSPQEGNDMDSMDNVRERLAALEQQMRAMGAHTYTVERQLRWWRGIACGVMLLGLVSLPLQSGTAADTQPGAMAERMATLENKLSAMTFDGAANEVVISGANLRIVNGLGATDTTNGVGNLIVGYNELRQPGACVPPPCINERTGSHNVVVGLAH